MTSPVGAIGKLFETPKRCATRIAAISNPNKKVKLPPATQQPQAPVKPIDGKGLIVDIKA